MKVTKKHIGMMAHCVDVDNKWDSIGEIMDLAMCIDGTDRYVRLDADPSIFHSHEVLSVWHKEETK